jgi:hypothetical protein
MHFNWWIIVGKKAQPNMQLLLVYKQVCLVNETGHVIFLLIPKDRAELVGTKRVKLHPRAYGRAGKCINLITISYTKSTQCCLVIGQFLVLQA